MIVSHKNLSTWGKGSLYYSILQLNVIFCFMWCLRSDGFVIAGDFFKDLQEEFRNWEASAASQGKPKSLWEELSVRHPAYIFICLFWN